MSERVLDLLGVGVGPFNLSLAALADPIDELDCLFLDARDEFDWHPGMLLPDATVQTPFLADLVTLADPTSRFSFLSFLKDTGRLYPFYIRERFQPLRSDFNDYCRWAVEQLGSLRFGREVVEARREDELIVVRDSTGETHRTRNLVLGTGTSPHLPPCCDPLPGDAVHTSGYLGARERLLERGSVAVVGGGQSAAEVVFDLLSADDELGVTWITRSPRFLPLEYTKLTLELTSPEYADYVHGLPERTRDGLVASQSSLYKGIDSELVNSIFDLLYRRERRRSEPAARLLTNTELIGVEEGFTLRLRQHELERSFDVDADGLVLATGYRYREPAFLAGLEDSIARDAQGRFAVARNYAIADGVFVQNAELHTHGFVAPDLGMAAYRSSCILRELLGEAPYPIEERIAFQDFGAPKEAARA